VASNNNSLDFLLDDVGQAEPASTPSIQDESLDFLLDGPAKAPPVAAQDESLDFLSQPIQTRTALTAPDGQPEGDTMLRQSVADATPAQGPASELIQESKTTDDAIVAGLERSKEELRAAQASGDVAAQQTANKRFNEFQRLAGLESAASIEGEGAGAEQFLGAAEPVFRGLKSLESGLTLGLSDLVLDRLGKAAGAELNAQSTGEQIANSTLNLIGAVLSGRAVAGAFGGLKKVQELSSLGQLFATRLGTAGITSGVRSLASLDAGVDPKTAAANFGQSVAASLIGIFPEQTVGPGVSNFLAQVGTDLAFDMITDLGLRDRLQDQSFMDWFIKEEMPQLAMSIVFGLEDNATKSGRLKLQRSQGEFDMFARKTKKAVLSKFKKDLAEGEKTGFKTEEAPAPVPEAPQRIEIDETGESRPVVEEPVAAPEQRETPIRPTPREAPSVISVADRSSISKGEPVFALQSGETNRGVPTYASRIDIPAHLERTLRVPSGKDVTHTNIDTKLSNVVGDEKLFADFPEAENVRVDVRIDPDGVYDPVHGQVSTVVDATDKSSIGQHTIRFTARNIDEASAGIAHELQHVVQILEGRGQTRESRRIPYFEQPAEVEAAQASRAFVESKLPAPWAKEFLETIDSFKQPSPSPSAAPEAPRPIPASAERIAAQEAALKTASNIDDDVTVKQQQESAATRPDNTTALTKEEIARIRDASELDQIEPEAQRTFADRLNRVKAKGLDQQAEEVARGAIKNKGNITDDEFVAMILRTAQLEDERAAIVKKAADLIDAGKPAEAAKLQTQLDVKDEILDVITEAARFRGSKAGGALNLQRLRINREVYTLAGLKQALKVAKGDKLTVKENVEAKNLTDQIRTLEDQVAKLTAAADKMDAGRSKKNAGRVLKEEVGQTRRRRKQAGLAEEQADLKKQLATMGHRVNDVTGLAPEAARIIGKLAINHIKQGATTLEAVAERVRLDVPDLTDRQVWDSLAGKRRTEKSRQRKEARSVESDLKIQARLEAKIDDAQKGIFDQPALKASDSARVKELRKLLKKLKTSAFRTINDDMKLKEVQLKIQQVQDQLATGQRDVKKARPEDRADITKAKQDLADLRALMRTNDKIADLDRQIAEDDFAATPQRDKRVRLEELENAAVKLAAKKRDVKALIDSKKPLTRTQIAREVGSLSRATLATADMSGALRQAAILGARRPGTFAKSFGKAFGAFFSQHKADAIDFNLRNHPNQVKRDKSGLFLATLDGPIRAGEEQFASRLAEKILGFGKLVKGSNRNMTTMLNMMRAASFDQFAKTYPNATDVELRAWADYVNKASGRGDLGSFNRAAEDLATAFFAPRFTASRVQTPLAFFKNWKNPRVRNEIAKDFFAFSTVTASAIGLAQLAGADVGTDPESSDWGKIIVGNTRIDLFAGLQQPARILAVAALKGKQAFGGREVNTNLRDLMSRFVFYKLNPTVTGLVALVEGKNAIGQEQGKVETLIRAFAPLVWQEVHDLWVGTHDPVKTTAAGAGAFFGLSISEHTPRKKSRRRTRRR